MQHPCHIQQCELKLADQLIHYRLYRNPSVKKDRKLVLLHGAGVAGEDTWHSICAFLDQWSEILVPDLRGMGKTRSIDGHEYPYTIGELVSDTGYLVDSLGWGLFDLAGYSLGGLVSMLYKQGHNDRVAKQYLIESAVLDRSCWQMTLALRDKYQAAAEVLEQGDAREGVVNFLNTISPNRKVSTMIEQVTIDRLSMRPQGFSHALRCVTSAMSQLNREEIIAAQGDVTSFIGGGSVELMHHYHCALADMMSNWHYYSIVGTDHSLPFQKPRQIAKIMNDELKRYVSN